MPVDSKPAVAFRAPPIWVVSIFLALGLVAIVAAFFIPMGTVPTSKPAAAEQQPTPYPDAPVFYLTERDGSTKSSADLDGKIWVAAFAFTRCQFCPQVSATMDRLQSELKLANRDDLRFVTFTIDPDHDTPDELKKYAQKFHADPSKWWFLHGPKNYLHLLSIRGFKAGIKTNESGPISLKYDHFLDLIVVDKQGRIRGTFTGLPPEREGGQEKYWSADKDLKRLIRQLETE